MVSRLDQLVSEFMAREFAMSPTLATAVGADGYDALLPDLSESAILANERADDDWCTRFSELPDDPDPDMFRWLDALLVRPDAAR